MRLGYLYSRYPVLSQTFCDGEMLELERREHEIILGSLYPPKTALRHEYLKKLRAPIRYAPSSRELDALARKAKRGGRWPSALVAQHEKKYGAEFVGAETDFSRDLLAARCPESRSKIFRVYNGIDLSRFPWREVLLPVPGRAEARPSKIRFLSVGRLVAFKGFDILIDTCAELQKQGINFDCEIIGDGTLREELEERARRQDLRERIRFAGEQSQNYVRSALRDCDVFVLASAPDERGASDIFPTVIAEAMATGKPVVSTTV